MVVERIAITELIVMIFGQSGVACPWNWIKVTTIPANAARFNTEAEVSNAQFWLAQVCMRCSRERACSSKVSSPTMVEPFEPVSKCSETIVGRLGSACSNGTWVPGNGERLRSSSGSGPEGLSPVTLSSSRLSCLSCMINVEMKVWTGSDEVYGAGSDAIIYRGREVTIIRSWAESSWS